MDNIINNYPVSFVSKTTPTYLDLLNLNSASIELQNGIMAQDSAVKCYDDPQGCLPTAQRLINLASSKI